MNAREIRLDKLEDIYSFLWKEVRFTLIGEGEPEGRVMEALQEAGLSLWQQLQAAQDAGTPRWFNHSYIFNRAKSRLYQLEKEETRCRIVPQEADVMAEATASDRASEPEAEAILHERINHLDPRARDLYDVWTDPASSAEAVAQRQNTTVSALQKRISRFKRDFLDDG